MTALIADAVIFGKSGQITDGYTKRDKQRTKVDFSVAECLTDNRIAPAAHLDLFLADMFDGATIAGLVELATRKKVSVSI